MFISCESRISKLYFDIKHAFLALYEVKEWSLKGHVTYEPSASQNFHKLGVAVKRYPQYIVYPSFFAVNCLFHIQYMINNEKKMCKYSCGWGWGGGAPGTP